MSAESSGYGNMRPVARMLLFPFMVLLLYGILFALMPEKILAALMRSGTILLNMIVPLLLVFVLMVLLNLFLNTAQISRFLGRGAGIRGILLPAVAGIISTGSIYVWYPLLRNVRERGAGDSSIAIFLYNRAVKPFLLPVMVGYFGWVYVAVLTVCTVLGSFVVGYLLDAIPSERSP